VSWLFHRGDFGEATVSVFIAPSSIEQLLSLNASRFFLPAAHRFGVAIFSVQEGRWRPSQPANATYFCHFFLPLVTHLPKAAL
jgi:hypothetical protein